MLENIKKQYIHNSIYFYNICVRLWQILNINHVKSSNFKEKIKVWNPRSNTTLISYTHVFEFMASFVFLTKTYLSAPK